MEGDEDSDEAEAEGGFGAHAATDFQQHSRSYDDEDAALQAALRASMEDVPEGWVAPDLQPKKASARKLPDTPAAPSSTGTQGAPAAPQLASANTGVPEARTPTPAWRVAGEQPVAPKNAEEAPGEEVGSPVEELSPGQSMPLSTWIREE